MTQRCKAWIFVGWLVFVFFTSYLSLGSCDLVQVLVPLTMWLGTPILLFTALFGLYRLKQDDLAGFRWFAIVGGLCLTGIAILWLGGRICEWEIQRGKNFVSVNLTQLEIYKEKHGAYPTSLLQLELRPPRLLGYHHEQTSYRFHMEDPQMIWGGWLFESDRKVWIYHD